MNSVIINAERIGKSFNVGDQLVPVLKDINLKVNKGDFLVIFGPSGCGKSTLLHILLGLEVPTKGVISVLNKNIYDENEDGRSVFRKSHIGMVYQQPHWIKSLSVIENLYFPLTMVREPEQSRIKKAQEMLKMLQMEKWADYNPNELSSGQQQRISLARALITDPEIIIADEPTGNLDYESGIELMELLKNVNKQTGKTVIMVTHDLEYMRFAKTALRMLDGQVVEEFNDVSARQFLKSLHSKRGESYEN